jgi:hypothetical protein
MTPYISQQAQLGHLWLAEAERFEYNDEDLITVESAELADELLHHCVMADADPDFLDELSEWHDFIYQCEIMLPLEQSCAQGVLLPMGERALRLQSCPETRLAKLRWFFELCPAHVKSYLALRFSVLVRIDRARRTGSPEWCPATAKPAIEESAFFRPRTLKVRNYAR